MIAADDHAEIALRLHSRAASVGNQLLKFCNDLLFRLKNDREVDLETAANAIKSAHRQIVFLKMLANRVEKKIPSGHPKMNSIQTLKSRFQLMKNEYLKISVELQSRTSGTLQSAIKTALENDSAGLSDQPEMLNIRTVEDQF